MHVCVLNTASTDDMVLKYLAISIDSAEYIFMQLD